MASKVKKKLLKLDEKGWNKVKRFLAIVGAFGTIATLLFMIFTSEGMPDLQKYFFVNLIYTTIVLFIVLVK